MVWRYPDGSRRAAPPAHVVFDGFRRKFNDLTREQRDAIGYNEAVPVKREPFTAYETAWDKGEDLICRETVMAVQVDDSARAAHVAATIRAARDRLLVESDWTQLADSPLSPDERTAWATYRQGLRSVPQQAGFPDAVQWPVHPES
ncbi:tail fiber assembly protein [Pseudodesulfovibrio portus]|uniref:Phage tail assembly chaperone-like domain-containing protein n=1 Tax=Pseudodesulfovibrio portus TaxID=231439 RepID=A0ABN6RXB7_9BACT|nr:tail fiber assembly protein [Pseudodesulfovibrio portus]BDQ34056.1 hypothetical protein JCM14722_15980 [Pseudodesulfovibrio portus]